MGAHCRGLSFQALVAPRVLQTEEFSQIWRTRMATLARLPRILDDIPQMDADRVSRGISCSLTVWWWRRMAKSP